jgi:hypothetical protein
MDRYLKESVKDFDPVFEKPFYEKEIPISICFVIVAIVCFVIGGIIGLWIG